MADSKNILCENIARYRKNLGLTQEELGRRVGVSTQAVSKWENGGMPDPMLLPSLAEALNATIDTLFGRDGGTYQRIEELLDAEIAGAPVGKRLHRTYELCWAMMQSAMCSEEYGGHSVTDIINAIQLKPGQKENYIPLSCGDEGLQIISISEDRPFYICLPEPEQGYSSMLLHSGSYEKLFILLARPNRFRVLVYLERVEHSFTPGYLAARLSITVEEAEEALLDLNAHGMCAMSALDTEAGLTRTFSKRGALSTLPFLVAAGILMNDPMDFLLFSGRSKPVLTAELGTENPRADWETERISQRFSEFNTK